uniref:Uncharacterized protein n=1 Tax=viral metagenome TaxID=1070528 RepID=A0A6C0EU47_9ZZZZ
MNVIDNYKQELLNLGDPIEMEDDTYFCKFSYNNMPFMIKTNKICVYKKRKKNKDNYVNISITSKDYLVWFETFYQTCIETFFERSSDWFEEPLTLSDIEFSFINPLKSNIKDNCFDIQCVTNEDRLHIVDTQDNVSTLELLDDCNVIPTFHIKGVKFNSKHFMFDIEVNNIYIIRDETEQDEQNNNELVEQNEQNNNEHVEQDEQDKQNNNEQVEQDEQDSNEIVNEHFEPNETQELKNDLNELSEFSLSTDNLEEMSMDIESNGFYKIYELIDSKIKDNITQNLQKMFLKKKIKINIDISDIFDEDEEE